MIIVNMIENEENGFSNLLSAISTGITFNLLKLYKKNSYNLTDSAKQLGLPISTVQDNLRKLLQSNLIFIREKKYYLSSFGSYILSNMHQFEHLYQLRNFFGKIPSDLIPNTFLEEIISLIDYIDIHETSWHFLKIFDKLLSKFKEKINNGNFSGELRVLGWWNLDFDFELLRTYFPDKKIDAEFYLNFFENITFQQIIDEKFALELFNREEIRDIRKFLDKNNDIRIIANKTLFNFTIMEIEGSMCLFLVKNNKLDVNHHFFINHPKIHSIFDIIFNYYKEKTISFHEFLERI